MEEMTWEEYKKQEDEMNLFGFTINDFKRESFFFFRSQVVQSMELMNEKFMELVRDASPDIIRKVADLMRIAEKNVLKTCEPSIKNIVNSEMERSLYIPGDMIIPSYRYHLYSFANDELIDLERECIELRTTLAQDRMFTECLTKEIDTYEFKNKLKNVFLLTQGLFSEK